MRYAMSGGLNLGTIALNTGFAGALGGGLDGDNVKVRATGSFQFLSQTLSIPALEFDGSLHSFAEIPGRIADWIVSKATEIFREIFSDAARWLAAIAAELLRGVENIALAQARDHGADTVVRRRLAAGLRMDELMHESELGDGR